MKKRKFRVYVEKIISQSFDIEVDLDDSEDMECGMEKAENIIKNKYNEGTLPFTETNPYQKNIMVCDMETGTETEWSDF